MTVQYITPDTSLEGLMNQNKTLILRKGNKNSLSVFRPKHLPLYRTSVEGFSFVDNYDYDEEDRVATLYPFVTRINMKLVNQVLKELKFDVAVCYDMPIEPKLTISDSDFFNMLRQLGCHNFHIVGNHGNKSVCVAIKGFNHDAPGYRDVVMKNVLDLGASYALYCKIIMEYQKTIESVVPISAIR